LTIDTARWPDARPSSGVMRSDTDVVESWSNTRRSPRGGLFTAGLVFLAAAITVGVVGFSAYEELLAWDNQVGVEDTSLVESVQRGLDSGAVPQGRLMPQSEQLIADFQRRVRDSLLQEP